MDPTVQGGRQPWAKGDPLQFLEALKRDPRRVFPVSGKAPSGWIRQSHAEVLLTLLGSQEPASPVMEIKCPSVPKAPSTVGKQAAYLLLGFVEDRYPPSGNSELQWYSDPQIRQLTSARMQSHPMRD